MSRTYDHHAARTRKISGHYGGLEMTAYDWSKMNPPSGYRQMWREQARAQQNHRLRACRDCEELVIETKIQKLTCIYDWY